MSIHVMNLVWGIRAGELTTAQRFVLLALADAADDDGGCFPGVEYIAEKVDLHERTARRHLDALEEYGWFRRVRRHMRSSYTYYIDIEKLNDLQRPRRIKTGRKCPVGPGESARSLPGRTARSERAELPAPNHQRSISREPSGTTSAGRPNRYSGKCGVCGETVAAGAGILDGVTPVHTTCPRDLYQSKEAGMTAEDYKL